MSIFSVSLNTAPTFKPKNTQNIPIQKPKHPLQPLPTLEAPIYPKIHPPRKNRPDPRYERPADSHTIVSDGQGTYRAIIVIRLPIGSMATHYRRTIMSRGYAATQRKLAGPIASPLFPMVHHHRDRVLRKMAASLSSGRWECLVWNVEEYAKYRRFVNCVSF